MSMVKRLQKQYSIQIVSVTEGIIFDYDTPGSYFRTGLQLLLPISIRVLRFGEACTQPKQKKGVGLIEMLRLVIASLEKIKNGRSSLKKGS
jgi:hypothetical protein